MALTISLHPLVIINVSDHYTRQIVRTSGQTKRVFGALLGIQSGRNVEIYNSFELVYNDQSKSLDLQFLTEKEKQMKTVFPNYDLLGWYSTGKQIEDSDLDLNKQILEFNESPLYLLIDPAIGPAQAHQKDLPITIFETEMKAVNDKMITVFTKAPFKIETVEAERIAVDHIAHVSSTGSGEGALISHLGGMQNAIQMLHLRIKIILEFVKATKEGKIPMDHALLRRIASMTQLLPTMNTPAFREDFLREYNDTLLVTYLASITKGTNALNELIDKHNMAQDHQHRGRGGWGGMMGGMGMMGMGGMGMMGMAGGLIPGMF